jgi:transposase InsO family protein
MAHLVKHNGIDTRRAGAKTKCPTILGRGTCGRYSSGCQPIKKWFKKWLNRYQTGQKEWYKDLPRGPPVVHNKVGDKIEQVVVKIRKSLMDGTEDSSKYSFVGDEVIRFRMEGLGYEPSEIPSRSTIKRIIKRNKLRVNTKERYKRVRSKRRHTIIKPKYVDEMHEIDFVGPRHIKGFGPINSLHLKDVVGRQVAWEQYVGKSMNNVMDFLLDYWKSHPIPWYLQTDNGMSFAGDYTHPRSISRFVRLCLYVGIEVIFIAPAKPWINGTIESFNKEFDRLFWKRETFTSLSDIKAKSAAFYASQNEFYTWKWEKQNLKSVTPKRMLRTDFKIDLGAIPLVAGKIHFIRIVDSKEEIFVFNERFRVGEAYIGDFVWATIDTKEQSLGISYNDEEMIVRKIKRFEYEIHEPMQDLDDRIFLSRMI